MQFWKGESEEISLSREEEKLGVFAQIGAALSRICPTICAGVHIIRCASSWVFVKNVLLSFFDYKRLVSPEGTLDFL